MNTTARRIAALSGTALLIVYVSISSATVAQPAAAPAPVAESAAAPAALRGLGDGAARSDERRAVRVRGQQLPVDVANGLYKMEGSLVGDWHYIPTEVLHDTPTLYAEAGVEVFDGCIDRRPMDGRCTRRDYRGELHMAFLYWASFNSNGDLIKGQCVHPITGGRGDFAGARGLLKMFDRPVGDQVKTKYRGRVVLNAVPTEGDAETPSASTATSATSPTSPTSQRRAC